MPPTLCAEVELLVSSIRASLFESLEAEKLSLSPAFVKNVFDILNQLLRNEGLSPSIHDLVVLGRTGLCCAIVRRFTYFDFVICGSA